MIQDLRYSIRLLIKSPGFALTAILSLALGIGATTAVFSLTATLIHGPVHIRDTAAHQRPRPVRAERGRDHGLDGHVRLHSRRISGAHRSSWVISTVLLHVPHPLRGLSHGVTTGKAAWSHFSCDDGR